MENEKNDGLWRELTMAEAMECAGGIVTTGPVRLLNLVAIVASGPLDSDGLAETPATGHLG